MVLFYQVMGNFVAVLSKLGLPVAGLSQPCKIILPRLCYFETWGTRPHMSISLMGLDAFTAFVQEWEAKSSLLSLPQT